MTGRSFSVDSPAYFSNIYRNLLPGESLFPEIVPAGVRSVYSVQVADAQAYSDRIEKYVDAVGKLDSRRARWTALKKESGISPDAWYKALAVREVAVAEVPSGSGFGKVILVRPGKQDLSVISGEAESPASALTTASRLPIRSEALLPVYSVICSVSRIRYISTGTDG